MPSKFDGDENFRKFISKLLQDGILVHGFSLLFFPRRVCVCAFFCFTEYQCNMFNKFVDIREIALYFCRHLSRVSQRSSLYIIFFYMFDANLIAHTLIHTFTLNLSALDPVPSLFAWCVWLVLVLFFSTPQLLSNHLKPSTRQSIFCHMSCSCVYLSFTFSTQFSNFVKIYGQKYANPEI